jgi:uncharacterized protein with HEPN domain
MSAANDPRVRLGHILREIFGIEETVRGVPFEEVARTYTLVRSVERGLQIISEAAKALPEDVRQRAPEVSWRQIVSLGNYPRHEYHRIDMVDVEDIVTVHLPALRASVEALPRSLDDDRP